MADVGASKHAECGQERTRARWLAALAAKQHGVVAIWQLRKLGYSRRQIEWLARRGHLHRLYRGVYAVGHKRLTTRGRWMAAVLAGGPEAVLSHRAAIALWDLRPVPSGPIDVTVPGRKRHGQNGVRIHNVRRLHPDDRTTLDGIPVTTVHRALLDYAEVAQFQQLRHAIDAAERRELLDGRELERLYARSKGRRGLKPLKEAVAELRGPAPWTQSELERRFLAMIRQAGLPEPQTNKFVEGFLVDLWWPEARLVVEIDGYSFHKDRRKFASDRLQDTKLQLANCMSIRVTQDRMQNEPRALLDDVIRGLARLSAGPAAAASGP
jgi:predicted transcriptional regulator of viral defense system